MITQVTETSDMGFEFSAITTQGVIYAEPGMLLSFSKGHWPFNGKEAKKLILTKMLKSFVRHQRIHQVGIHL